MANMLRHPSSFLFLLKLGSNEPEAASSYLLPPTWRSRGTHLLSQYLLVPIVLFCVMSFNGAVWLCPALAHNCLLRSKHGRNIG